MKLDKDKQKAFDLIKKGENVFVTGVAGTGKSYFLNYLKENLKKEMSITATTGIASVGIGGSTLHSYCGIGLAQGDVKQILKDITPKGYLRIMNTKILVIDEVSMISAELFDKIDAIFRIIKKNDCSFGGVQIILLGDFLQLSPVDRENKESFFCFESKAWEEGDFKVVELKTVYRQEDKKFVDILNRVREGKMTEEDIKILKGRVYTKGDVPNGITPIILTGKNNRASHLNKSRLDLIPFKKKVYNYSWDGIETKVEKLVKDARIETELVIKKGTQVMMMVNKYNKRGVVNGSMGVVIGYGEENGYPIVKFENGESFEVFPFTWAFKEYSADLKEMETIATVKQVPLRLAWAITIHKAQGLTLSYLYVESWSIFCNAQAYVAFSRAKNFNGLFINGFDVAQIKCNKKAILFYKEKK